MESKSLCDLQLTGGQESNSPIWDLLVNNTIGFTFQKEMSSSGMQKRLVRYKTN